MQLYCILLYLYMVKNKISHLDRAGVIVSFICAIHCALLPVLLSFISFAGFAVLQSSWVETIIVSSSVLLATLSLLKSYRRHRKPWPLIFVILGFSLLYAGHRFEVPIGWLWLTLGGMTVATSHLLNWRLHSHCIHE